MTSFLDLPWEIQYEILLQSPYQDVLSYCEISAVTKRICDSKDFWKDKLFRDYGIKESNKPRKIYEKKFTRDLQIFFRVIAEGNTAVVKESLDYGISPNSIQPGYKKDFSTTPIYEAIIRGYPDIVKLLIDYGADISGRHLSLASTSSNPEVIEVLLDAGINPDETNALVSASTFSNFENVDTLLEHDADPNVQDVMGRTALSVAVLGRDTDIVELLLEENADPNIPDDQGLTPIQRAYNTGDREIIDILLSK
jgi:ankyrin repeat protein